MMNYLKKCLPRIFIQACKFIFTKILFASLLINDLTLFTLSDSLNLPQVSHCAVCNCFCIFLAASATDQFQRSIADTDILQFLTTLIYTCSCLFTISVQQNSTCKRNSEQFLISFEFKIVNFEIHRKFRPRNSGCSLQLVSK